MLYFNQGQLRLQFNKVDGSSFSQCVDFLDEKSIWKQGSLIQKNQIFTKAVGLKKGCLSVLDTTAGWGQDSMMLKTLGFNVTAVEENPLVYLLLRDGLRRFDEATPELKSPINLIHANSIAFIEGLSSESTFDVVYVDPMFPGKKKKALSGKPMQILKELVPTHEEKLGEILNAAFNITKKRLVLKRPLRDKIVESVWHKKADISFLGKAIRYDVFLK
ncbi:MAG: class I SAM-dependent methyltransferase [Bdellovibrionaceae bacterium]|nr:class I SAM-dependent methyltransferase [Pseudobdellovibrionaceae bacterium]